MRNINQYDTDHLNSMRSWIVIQKKMWWTPELHTMLDIQLENIWKEIAKRLQLTLDFDQELEDGAYED